MAFDVVPWPDMNFYRDGIPNRERHLTIKLDGELLRHKEFFESNDEPNVVYCFHYICDHEKNGQKYKCLHAGALDRKTRIQQRSWGSDVIRHFDLRDTSITLTRIPDFKEHDPKAEAARLVWEKFPAEVHEKYLSQGATRDRNEDGSPNFVMIGVMGPDDLEQKLTVMKADYYGAYMPHPKFPVAHRTTFKNEQEAIDTFFEDPRAWLVYKWDGKRWLQATLKRQKDGKSRTVSWEADS